jgi:hypothetical protein
MSGIIGSKLNIRGSGRIAKLGTDGQVLTSSGPGVQANYEDAAGGGVSWQSVVTASTFTAVAGNGYPVNTTSNACTVTLPASASVGDEIIFTDYARNFATNALTIDQNSLNYQGNSSPNPEYDTDGESIHIVYMDATKGWVPTFDGAVALETPQTYNADILVVAGGGSSRRGNAGGAGGGGMRTISAQSLTGGAVYTIVVGVGGAGTVAATANDGLDSSIAGTGITGTFTSTGGGHGADSTYQGGDGGAGGGGGYNNATGGGHGNTPSTSPSQGADGGEGSTSAPGYPGHGGGGGGASGVAGQNAPSTTVAGNGGAGTANSITGSSVSYAGGGGGSIEGSNTAGTGGTGGGGDGKNTSGGAGGSGTDGLGGGGGATFHAGQAGGDGGNGVVILSMADADYSGTTTGSPTVATGVSGNTILTFTAATGSYTA